MTAKIYLDSLDTKIIKMNTRKIYRIASIAVNPRCYLSKNGINKVTYLRAWDLHGFKCLD